MKNLVLVGFMGSGKTVVGKLVAQHLGMRFIDMDEEIEKRAGKKISEIFAHDGESYFRRLERVLTKELAGQEGLVVATGGGIVLDPRNITDFRKNAILIGLGVHVDTVLRRVGRQTHRPLLEGRDKRGQVEKLLELRGPLYHDAGTYIETDNRTIDEVVTAVAAVYHLGSVKAS